MVPAAGFDAGLHAFGRIAVIIPEPVPAPKPGGHHRPETELHVAIDHPVVDSGIGVVIVPVDQFDIPGNRFADSIRNDRAAVIIIPACAAQPEVHIAPDHRMEAVFSGESADPGQMAFENPERVLITVKIEGTATAEQVCLIHADVNAA